MNYYICEGKIDRKVKYNAGSKAVQDIEYILKELYFKPFWIKSIHAKSRNKILRPIRYIKYFINYFIWKKSFSKLKKNDTIVIQYPFNNRVTNIDGILKKYSTRVNIILFIHDIQSIRGMKINKRVETEEKKIFSSCNYIISHNESMTSKLEEFGVERSKIVNLKLFDYISNLNKKEKFNISKKDVTYVGNLSAKKAPFIYQIKDNKINFTLKLFGKGINENISKKILYCGAYLPNELTSKLDADLGLVWDGNCDESDEYEGYKNYTRYNNPHKLSCYIAAGLPVIVWKKSAVANFVNKYKIGYTINNLYEINDIDYSDYEEKLKNVSVIQEKVCHGVFTKDAINRVLERIKRN